MFVHSRAKPRATDGPFSDLTSAEWSQRMGRLDTSSISHNTSVTMLEGMAFCPESLDWRDQEAVTAVKDVSAAAPFASSFEEAQRKRLHRHGTRYRPSSNVGSPIFPASEWPPALGLSRHR